MTPDETTLRSEAIRQYCRQLRVPTVGSQFGRLAEEAVRQQHGPVRYLEALLAAEIEERERNAILRRVFEAKLPRMKTLEEFDFAQSPQVSAGRIHQLAEGAGSHALNRFCSLVNRAQGKLTWPPGCAYRHAGSGGVPDSPRRRHWSTNWLKPNIPTNSAGRWAAGRAMK